MGDIAPDMEPDGEPQSMSQLSDKQILEEGVAGKIDYRDLGSQ